MKIPIFVPSTYPSDTMWQRIQTLYLGIAVALIGSMFFCKFATIIGPGGEEIIINYYEKRPFLILLIMILIAQIAATGSYRMFILQARVCIIAAFLCLGFQIWMGIDYLTYHNDMVFSFTMMFPLAAAILDFIAARRSMVDEMTLQAVKGVKKVRRKRK